MSMVNQTNQPPIISDPPDVSQGNYHEGHGGTFRRVLGTMLGIAGNVFAPGLGSAIGGIIGGGLGGINTASGNPQQYLQLQQQMQQESEAYQSVSAVLKVKHDSAMAAINNIK